MHFGIRWAALAALAMSACGESLPGKQEEQQTSEVQDYVSKTPGAKIYMQPAPDRNIVLKSEGMRGGGVQVDTETGDKVRMQDADRERNIIYFAYSTLDDELVRAFMTQYGGGS